MKLYNSKRKNYALQILRNMSFHLWAPELTQNLLSQPIQFPLFPNIIYLLTVTERKFCYYHNIILFKMQHTTKIEKRGTQKL